MVATHSRMSEIFKTASVAPVVMDRMSRSGLMDMVNVGPAVARYLARVGITQRAQLVGRDPVELFEQLNTVEGRPCDPCLLDTIMSAVDQAEGHPGRPWWNYTAERKRIYSGLPPGRRTPSVRRAQAHPTNGERARLGL